MKDVNYYGYTVISPAPSGYDAARNAFVGVYDSLALPKAVKRGGCTNTAGTGEKLAAALQNDIILQPGETKTVSIQLKRDDFSLINREEQRVVEPGEFELMIGHSSRNEDLLKTNFRL